MVNNCINNILSVFYPQRCLLCEDPGNGTLDLCLDCQQSLRRNNVCCSICALPLAGTAVESRCCGRCQQQPPPYQTLLAPYLYQSPMDDLIAGFKYHRKLVNGRLLGQLLATSIHSGKTPLPQVLIPIPMHRKRLRERGFNQASELARQLSQQLNIPWQSSLLRRKNWSRPQRGLNRRQRKENIRNSFQISRGCAFKHVALIDDVVTTGATVTAAALTLKRAGVSRVDVWAVARTPGTV